MSAIAIAGVVFACVFGSALLGLLLALQISRDLLGTPWLRIAEQSGPAAIRSDGGFLAQDSLRHFWPLRTPQRNGYDGPRALRGGGFRLDLSDPGDAPAIRRVDEDLPRSDALRSLTTRTVIYLHLNLLNGHALILFKERLSRLKTFGLVIGLMASPC
jgi:hypothetical protein